MASLLSYYARCRGILRETAKHRNKITYGELAEALGLSMARQEWSTVLDPIYRAEIKITGRDLTLVVVYKSGPAKGLSRYFSNGRSPRSTMLDPRNPQQVQAFELELEKVFDTYEKLD